MLIQKSVFKIGFGEDSSSHKKRVELKSFFQELNPNITKKEISKFIHDNLLRLGFEFHQTDIEFSGTVIENTGIQASMKPKTILNNLNNLNKSFNIFFYPNGTLYLQISDLNFITPILNPLSTIETFYEIKGQTNVAFIIYLKVISPYGKPSKEYLHFS